MTGSNYPEITIDSIRDRLAAMVGPDEVERARRRLRRKSLYIVTGFLGGYALVVSGAGPLLTAFGLVAVAVCSYASITAVMHDANHGAMFESARLNRLAGYWLDLFGASSLLWCLKHNGEHHENTNINEHDSDVRKSPFFRLNRYQKWRTWYRFQHLYAPLLYGFMTMQIFLADFANLVKLYLGGRQSAGPKIRDLVAFAAGKIAFMVWAVVLPFIVHGWWGVVGSFVAMWCVGICLALTVQVAHVVGDVDHYEFSTDDSLRGFVQHQVSASADVETKGVLGGVFAWLAGGLDRQVAHHLAPSLPHTLYPALQEHIEELCAEFDTRYRSHSSMVAAVAAHFRWLRSLGRCPDPAV